MPVNTNRNAVKFEFQQFSLIDTNAAAEGDPNLYNACLAMPVDMSTNPVLSVTAYGTNALIIKADHFDYSVETLRDFALLVCDRSDTPIWKSIDLSGSSDAKDGWLVQGIVANWQVTDPMFLLVTNTVHDCNAFYHAIPYGGAQITVIGANAYDVVSNTITLQASILDLSGVTNEQLNLDVNGGPARYTLAANNTIQLDTHYNPNSIENVNVSIFNARARVYDTNNIPDNAKLFFASTGSLPLDFENDVYVAFQSDNCAPDAGTNYVEFYVAQDGNASATIADTATGRIVAKYPPQFFPGGTTIAVPWNMTEADGTTPYSNTTYTVTFNAGTNTIWFTNSLDKGGGVRPGGGCLLSYQYEDPSTMTGMFLNSSADTQIGANLLFLFTAQYSPNSLTQYGVGDVGPARNTAACYPYKNAGTKWATGVGQLTNKNFSEITIAQAHGSGGTIGGSKYLPDTFGPQDLQLWCETGYTEVNTGQFPHATRRDWRLRKALLSACYTGSTSLPTAGGLYSTFPEACGIRPIYLEEHSYGPKNVGLFFGGLVPQGSGNATTADFSEAVDQTWVCGKLQYPGGCSPDYTFRFAAQASIGRFPWIASGLPVLFGYKYCVYSIYADGSLDFLDTSTVNDN